MVGEVWRPEVLVAVGVGGCPRGAVGEGGADILPGNAVGGGLEADAVGGEGCEVGAIRLLHDGRVVNEGVTLDRAGVDSTLLEMGCLEMMRCQSTDGEKTTGEEGADGNHDEVSVSGYP